MKKPFNWSRMDGAPFQFTPPLQAAQLQQDANPGWVGRRPPPLVPIKYGTPPARDYSGRKTPGDIFAAMGKALADNKRNKQREKERETRLKYGDSVVDGILGALTGKYARHVDPPSGQGVDPSLIANGLAATDYMTPGQQAATKYLLQDYQERNAPPQMSEYDKRAQAAAQHGLDPNSADWTSFVLEGKLPERAERQIIKGADGFQYYQDTGERVLPNVPQTPEPGYQMLTPDQVQQMGLPQGSYQQGPKGRISQIGGSNTTVNLNAAGEPDDAKLRQKLFEDTGKLWSGYRQQGAVAASNLRDLDILEELADQAATGPVTGRLSQMFPGFDSAGAAFQSIVKRVAPTLRAEGSGSTSDVEYAGMLAALPSLQNKPNANRAIIGVMRAKAEIDMERADIVTRYSTGEISAADAQRQMAELNNRSILTPEMRQLLDFSKQPTPDGAPLDELLKKYGGNNG